MRGFTTISETFKDDPQGLTKLMNRLLTPLTNSIIERKGTIDKYIGDAIMAFWNAPLDDAAHEVNACAAALDMLREIEDLNHEREAEALEDGMPFFPMKIGLGINTGTCVVGNMGSDLRFDYSVLGDPREPRLPARRPIEVIRNSDHPRRAHGREGQRALCRVADRPDHRQGQDRARKHLCAAWRRGGGQGSELQNPRRTDARNDDQLP